VERRPLQGDPMKKASGVLFIFFVAFFFSGCVSIRTHEELRNQNRQLNQELVLLKQKNESLSTENVELKQVPEYYYRQGLESFNEGKYGDALNRFLLLLERFPTFRDAAAASEKISEIRQISLNNYNKIITAEEEAKDPKTKVAIIDRELKKNNLSREHMESLLGMKDNLKREMEVETEAQRDMNRHIVLEDDPTKSVRYYQSSRWSARQIGYERNLYIELYVAQKYTGKKHFKFRTRYVAPDYLSYEQVILQGDNGVHLEIDTIYPYKRSSVEEHEVREWSDNELTEEEKVLKLAKAGNIIVQFKGGYRYSFEMNEEQLTAFKEVVHKYNSIR
jgi:hypothetical protein